jgi:hypothetical protein
VPSRRTVVVVDLTSKRVVARFDTGLEPFDLAMTGER